MEELLPKILLISLIAGVIAQAIKVLIKINKSRKIKATYLDDYGGMPSAHAAFLIALLTAIGLSEGILTTSFAVAFVISAILIRDAIGIRMELEKHGKMIKEIVEKQNLEKQIEFNGKLADRMGHTYPEIIVGALIGFFVALALNHIL